MSTNATENQQKSSTDSADNMAIAEALLLTAFEQGTTPDFKEIAKQTGVSPKVLAGKWSKILRERQISADLLGSAGAPQEQPPAGTVYVFTPEMIENLKAGLTAGQRKLVESYQNAPGVRRTVGSLAPNAARPVADDLGLDMREVQELLNVIRRERLKALLQEQALRGLAGTFGAEQRHDGDALERLREELRAEIRALKEGDKLESLREWVEKRVSETAAAGKQPDPIVERLQRELDELKESKREQQMMEMMKTIAEAAKGKGIDAGELFKIQMEYEAKMRQAEAEKEKAVETKQIQLEGYKEQIRRERDQRILDEMARLREELSRTTREKGTGVDKLLETVRTAKELGKEFTPQTSSEAEKLGYEVLRDVKDMAKEILPDVVKAKAGGAAQAPQMTKTCDRCGTAIPIPPGATSITCPSCGATYHRGGQRPQPEPTQKQPEAAQQQPAPAEAQPATAAEPAAELTFPGTESLPP